jgi:hypothetical protein
MLVARGLGPVNLPLDRSVIAPVAKVAAERDLAELHLLAQGKKLITSHQHTPANHALVLFRCLSGIGGFRIVALVWRHADNGAVAAHGLDHVRVVLAVRCRLWVARAFAISVSFKISGKFDNAVAICGIKPEFSAFVGIGGQRSWSRWVASAKYEVRPMRDRSIPAHNEKLALEKLFGFCPDFHDLSFVKPDCQLLDFPKPLPAPDAAYGVGQRRLHWYVVAFGDWTDFFWRRVVRAFRLRTVGSNFVRAIAFEHRYFHLSGVARLGLAA